MKLSWKAFGGLFLAAVLSVPALADNTAVSGTLNFIEGQASIQSQPLTSKSVGSADLQPGQTLSTQNGRAEVLLTPGVFLRLDDNSAVTMISPSLTNTQIQLDRGRAELEVAEMHKENNLQVTQNGATTQIQKTGLYDFTADPDVVRVMKGQASVSDADQTVKVKGGHELLLNTAGNLHSEKFNQDQVKDDFYNWSKLRSEYLSEASVNAGQVYYGSVSPGWYWDPWLVGYTFIPGSGVLYSPFGFGFYSPGVYPVGVYAPYYHGFPRYGVHGYYGPAHFGRPGAAFHGGGFRGEGLHAGGLHGGDFHR